VTGRIESLGGGKQPSRYRRFVRANARTTSFLAHSAGRGLRQKHDYPEIPTRAVSPAIALSVWVDELVMGLLPRMPDVALSDVGRLSEDVDGALAAYAAHGWAAKPTAFYPAPTAPDRVELIPHRLGRTNYTSLSFASGFAPHEDVPGAERWMQLQSSDRAQAFLLQHPEPDRPWLVNLHGYSSGTAMDLLAFRAQHHHRTLGYNVIHPVLPLHGRRTRRPNRSGQGFLTLDYVQHLHSFAHAVWDVRRCLAWVRAQGGTSITVHGVSLGGMLTALLAALDPDIDRVIAGTPFVDVTKPVRHETVPPIRDAYEQHDLLGERLDRVSQVVSPLTMPCVVPEQGRFVYAGVVDRMTTPGEAHRLWTQWGRPEVCWYAGSHCASAWSREARRFVDGILGRSAV
jgi:pimeloyl-ACP methyl ester carboxylesterase